MSSAALVNRQMWPTEDTAVRHVSCGGFTATRLNITEKIRDNTDICSGPQRIETRPDLVRSHRTLSPVHVVICVLLVPSTFNKPQFHYVAALEKIIKHKVDTGRREEAVTMATTIQHRNTDCVTVNSSSNLQNRLGLTIHAHTRVRQRINTHLFTAQIQTPCAHISSPARRRLPIINTSQPGQSLLPATADGRNISVSRSRDNKTRVQWDLFSKKDATVRVVSSELLSTRHKGSVQSPGEWAEAPA